MKISSSSNIDELVEQGFEHLENEEYDLAIEIGRKLKERRHSSSFEILALAYNRKENLAEAISELEEGVKRAPKVWRLWQLLGNYYSDSEKFDKASKCYQVALKCPKVDESSVWINKAILLQRQKLYTESLQALERISDDGVRIRAASLKIDSFVGLHKFDEAIGFGENLLSEKQIGKTDEEIAELHASLSNAYFRDGRKADAERHVWRAIWQNKHCEDAQWLIREIRNTRSKSSKYYRILFHGTWNEVLPEENQASSFFTSYDVVADTVEEALEFVKEFEPPEISDPLRVEEAKVLEVRRSDPKGIYRSNGYSFYSSEN